MLQELSFTSYLERCRVCKQISEMKATLLKQPTSVSTCASATDSINANTVGLLSRPGKRGLDVACRSAYEMATSVCQNTQDTTLWLQMPHIVTNISANIKAYEIMQVIRKKHPDSSSTAQRASIALRNALALLIVNNYESFDEALLHIASITNLPMEAMRLLQSQVHFSRVSMTALAQQTTCIEDTIHKIFQVPLSHKEIADIHVAYQECTMRTTSNAKCNPFRPPKTKKKMELLNDKNAFEITYHDPVDPSLSADQMHTHTTTTPSQMSGRIIGTYRRSTTSQDMTWTV